MTIPFAAFLTVWAILAMNIVSPGPNVLNTITTAMGSGRAAGIASAMGVGLGIAVWCLSMSLGMAALFRVVPFAEAALTVMAAGLLIYFALRYLRAGFLLWKGRVDRPKGVEGLAMRESFLRSLAVNATNPKALTTWIAILGIFPTSEAGPADIGILAVGASALSFGIHTGYALAFSTGAAARAYQQAAPLINGAVGIFFTLFAVKLAAPLLSAAL